MDQNKMWALVAEMESVKAGIEAKKLANVIRYMDAEAPAYSEESFDYDVELFRDIAEKLRRL